MVDAAQRARARGRRETRMREGRRGIHAAKCPERQAGGRCDARGEGDTSADTLCLLYALFSAFVYRHPPTPLFHCIPMGEQHWQRTSAFPILRSRQLTRHRAFVSVISLQQCLNTLMIRCHQAACRACPRAQVQALGVGGQVWVGTGPKRRAIMMRSRLYKPATSPVDHSTNMCIHLLLCFFPFAALR